MAIVQVVTPSRANLRIELAQFREYLIAREKRHKLIMGFSDAQPIANNRNRIAKQFLKTQADYLLTIDSDTVPMFNPLDYVEADKDVLGFPYPTWRVNSNPPLIWFPKKPDGNGLRKVDKVGGGCLLIARRVLEKIPAPFLDEWNASGLRIEAEDITFCQKTQKAGFEIWCAMDKVCAHFKTVELVTLAKWIGKIEWTS